MNLVLVIPCYKAKQHILGVIAEVPAMFSHIIVVDDACPENSGKIAASSQDARLVVLYHKENKGVGGAMISGYKKALELGADIVIKVDGDGQMDLTQAPKLIAPILEGRAEFTKGNRFQDFAALKAMPKLRLFGNSALSFMLKAASGHWRMMDPTNGYTAISRVLLERIDLDNLAKRYFFESSLLIELGIVGAKVVDVPIPARYGNEQSSLSILKVLFDFPPKILKGLLRRIFYRYFIYDFNMASIYMLLGLPLMLFGLIFGSYEWLLSVRTGVVRSAGTVMLGVFPLIIGFQMLLQAIAIDIQNSGESK